MKPLLIIQRLALALLLFGFVAPGYVSADGIELISSVLQSDDDDEDKNKDKQYSLSIKEAKWKDEKSQLKAKGQGTDGQKVTLMSVASGQVLGQTTVESGKWKIKASISGVVPCRVRARTEGAPAVEKDVKNAPKDCDDGNGNPPPPPPPPPPVAGDYTVLAANDLGMHCADQDYRMFSILPPYNVLNAQVLRKGQEPRLMTPADGISLTYRAVSSNLIDPNKPNLPPIATDSLTSTNQNDLLNGIFKSNFWDIAGGPTGLAVGFLAYEKLYPPGILAAFPFEPDLGLPAPDVEEFYLLNPGNLTAEQAEMPGKSAPYTANQEKPFHGYVKDYPFFINFPFGYTVKDFRRFTAEGIPTGYIDDQGRTNAYPLMRVEAKDSSGKVLASLDAVTPVASEADCAICHATQNVCDYDKSNTLVCDDIANFKYSSNVSFLTDASMVIGATPEQQVINAAKINIMRLHDYKNGTSIAPLNDDGTNADGSTPNVVCANCHYSPALDLAHLGPNDDNGKEQTRHISMSRAMHSVHGNLPNVDPNLYGNLFPVMPPPDKRGNLDVDALLGETCYNCHPGKRTKCLRGAMGGAGTVCQDCHGQMTQVGDDFTESFASVPFPAGANLNKRVSWASEPKCQSCHVGDVMQVAQLKNNNQLQDVLVNNVDSMGNPDGLRLQMTYKKSDHVFNGGGTTLALLDYPNSRFATTEALYRLSGSGNKGHGDLSCENCHGSTHAIWPNKNPFSNDNKAAMDLQGHTGPIIECSTCHTGDMGITLDGPHGMHPVGNTRFSAGGHEKLAEKNKDACRACHGQNGEGSVLSRVAVDRTLTKDEHGNNTIHLAKGELVTCNLCHKNKL